MTSVKSIPLIISGFNGFGYDKDMPIPDIYSPDGKKIEIDAVEDDSFEDIEIYSGTSINSKLKSTISYEFNQDSIFTNDFYTLIPLIGLNRHGGISDSKV